MKLKTSIFHYIYENGVSEGTKLHFQMNAASVPTCAPVWQSYQHQT